MSKDTILYRVRKFLNKPGYHKGAFILAEASRCTYKGRKDKKTGKAPLPSIGHYFTLQIADCSRMIDLELSMGKKTEYLNSIKKLEILIQSLQKMRDIMLKEHIRTEQLVKEKKIKRERW